MKWIVTGAAGFIGCNTVAALLDRGDEVVGVDNLTRPGAGLNLDWLAERRSERFTFVQCDICDSGLADIFVAHDDVDVVLHLAAQVAVTTSILDPRYDFEVNALGTFNVCDAVRRITPAALLLYASTNKVYGPAATDVALENGRWWSRAADAGVDESAPLALHSPYACSKGAADQYVLDYFRTYGVRAASLRQSCVYGPRQFGVEDQGWVAWLTAAALAGEPFTIYGDGRQVRDLLFIDDLIALYVDCADSSDAIIGKALNVGGGPSNAVSILDLVATLDRRLAGKLTCAWAPERSGDQRFYVSNNSLAERLVGWRPRIGVEEGLERLIHWLEANLDAVIATTLPSRRQGLPFVG